MPENGVPRDFDPISKYYQLDERVTNLRSSVQHIENQVASILEILRTGSKTQWQQIWPGLSLVVVIMSAIGTLAYYPITSSQTDMKNLITGNQDRTERAIEKLVDNVVPRVEHEQFWNRQAEIDKATVARFDKMDASLLTRNEWTERNRARDNEVADLSRRIDDLQKSAGAVYGMRDVIVDLKEQVRALETRSQIPLRGLTPSG